LTFFVPEPLADRHHLGDFSCGVGSLDQWLRRRAHANSGSGASRVFVVCTEADVVVAYYSLSTGSVLRDVLPAALRRNTPQPIPILLIGRFAVDRRFQQQGLGRSLLQDVLERCARLSQEVGFMAILVHPAGEQATAFWRRFGFVPAPTQEPMLLLPTAHLTRHPAA
jgi:GNAT superfamily N-acetyltransferase